MPELGSLSCSARKQPGISGASAYPERPCGVRPGERRPPSEVRERYRDRLVKIPCWTLRSARSIFRRAWRWLSTRCCGNSGGKGSPLPTLPARSLQNEPVPGADFAAVHGLSSISARKLGPTAAVPASRLGPRPAVRSLHPVLGQEGYRHRSEELQLAHGAVAAARSPARRMPADREALDEHGVAVLQHSGSVIRVFVMWVWTALAPWKPGPRPRPPQTVS